MLPVPRRAQRGLERAAHATGLLDARAAHALSLGRDRAHWWWLWKKEKQSKKNNIAIRIS